MSEIVMNIFMGVMYLMFFAVLADKVIRMRKEAREEEERLKVWEKVADEAKRRNESIRKTFALYDTRDVMKKVGNTLPAGLTPLHAVKEDDAYARYVRDERGI